MLIMSNFYYQKYSVSPMNNIHLQFAEVFMEKTHMKCFKDRYFGIGGVI